ncbi:STAS domain-containing protein [Streptomyces sp. NPDC059385]|uniref:STAS domain-containing protein n=1 Tax=Streptomyces sp. NPDC059385 TaxID=3346817 RepID=UPI00369FC21C
MSVFRPGAGNGRSPAGDGSVPLTTAPAPPPAQAPPRRPHGRGAVGWTSPPASSGPATVGRRQASPGRVLSPYAPAFQPTAAGNCHGLLQGRRPKAPGRREGLRERAAPAVQPLDIAVRAHPKRTIVTLAGTIDMDTCPYFTQVINALHLDGRTLALDLTALTFMDSSGLNAFLALRQRAETEGGSLELVCVPQQALRVLDLTGTRTPPPNAAQRGPGRPATSSDPPPVAGLRRSSTHGPPGGRSTRPTVPRGLVDRGEGHRPQRHLHRTCPTSPRRTVADDESAPEPPADPG